MASLPEFVALVNRFTFSQFRAMADRPGNAFCSPKNIYDCLSLIHPAAQGETAEAFRRVGFLEDGKDGLRTGAAVNMMLRDNRADISTANGAWAQAGYPFSDVYVEMVKSLGHAVFETVDYRSPANYPAISDDINGWVGQKTKGKIRDLVGPQFFNPDSVLTLVSAIYFNAEFKTRFVEGRTRAQPFFREDGTTQDCQLMYVKEDFRLSVGEQFDVCEIPYAGDSVLDVILPRPGVSLASVVGQFGPDVLSARLAAMAPGETEVLLPKFRIESSFDLMPSLGKVGLGVALSDNADFSGMFRAGSGERGVKIGAAVHKAFVDTTEKGTEAAAATAVGMVRATAFGMEPPPRVFRADRPFLFLIRHAPTGMVLFCGRHETPEGY